MTKRLRPFILPLLLIFILYTAGKAQSIVGDWETYTSIIDFRHIVKHQNCILGATGGGLVKFDLDDKKFQVFGLIDGLSQIDLQYVETDKNGKLWICSGAPIGEINIWDIEGEEIIKIFDENVWDESITSFSSVDFYKNKAFAACQLNMDWGIFEFDCNDEYQYKDFYFNFPASITGINSIKVIKDSLWLCTNSGLFVTNPERSDLKAPEAWSLVAGSEGKTVTDIVEINSETIVNFDSQLYKIHGLKSEIYNSNFYYDILDLEASDELGLLVASDRGIFSVSNNTINNLISGNFSNVIINNNGLVGSEYRKGLILYNDGIDNNFIPNTMLSNVNTAICIDNENRLFASSNEGISYLTNNGWKNIVKGTSVNISQNSSYNWNYFIGDTINYNVESKIFSLIQRQSGDFLATLYGSYINHGRKGGILKFDTNDLENYETFDTTNGIIGSSNGYYLSPELMEMDSKGNVWITVHQGLDKNSIVVYTNNDDWEHFSINESDGHLTPLTNSIAFDNMGRVWVGSKTSSGSTISQGGIAVLDYNNTLLDKSDDQWFHVSTSDGLDNNDVFALVFDDEDILWIMTAGGIQKAEISSNFPNTIFSQIDDKPVFSNLSFSKECVIEVDGRNNKWISTTNGGGVKVYTDDGMWLNNYEGFTTENSGLLSNDVLDITFFESEGKVVLSTTKGISVYKSPYANTGNKFKELKIFPMPFMIPSSQPLVIDGLLPKSEVKIITLNGTVIKHLKSQDGTVNGVQAFWDGKNSDGRLVSSGVYLCMVYCDNGKSTVGKIAVVRK